MRRTQIGGYYLFKTTFSEEGRAWAAIPTARANRPGLGALGRAEARRLRAAATPPASGGRSAGGGRLACAPPRAQGRRSPACWRGPWGFAAQARPSSAGKARSNNYSSPICVRLMYRCPHACPRPVPACIVLPRAAPQPMRPREPREPDTAEDAGGQTDHSGQAFQGGLRKDTSFHKPPSFKNSLNPFIFSTLKSLFGRRVRSWLRTNAGGAPNTCKSRG